jgi:hypothetical protein
MSGVGAAEVLRAGLPAYFRIITGSMRPTLSPGTSVEVRPCTAPELLPGDIACIRTAGLPLLHRVLESGPARVVTQGDRLPYPDAAHAPDRVLGRVHQVRWLGLPVRLDRPVGRFAGRLASRVWAIGGFLLPTR